jgi:hypothetical protein
MAGRHLAIHTTTTAYSFLQQLSALQLSAMDQHVSTAPFSFQPPPGGDVSLKSSDGVLFIAHSTLLSLASPVFAGMISTATQSDVVELAEDSESVSVMLRYIYPPPFLHNNSLTLLDKALHMARKYQVDGITSIIEYSLLRPLDGESPMHADPIRVYAIATAYDLSEIRKAAIKLAETRFCDFGTTKGVRHLADVFPGSATALGLIGVHSVRTKALIDLLVLVENDAIAPLINSDDPETKVMMCGPCFEKLNLEMEDGVFWHNYRPMWLYGWGLMAYSSLTSKPLAECDHVFQVSSLDKLGELGKTCADCVNTVRSTNDGAYFEGWAQGVKSKIEKVFNDAETLYTL